MAEVTANAVESRLDFAVRIQLANALPETAAGKHIARQLLRSERHRRTTLKLWRRRTLISYASELNESCVWLRMACQADLMEAERIESLIDENQQLCRILNASIATSKRNNNDK